MQPGHGCVLASAPGSGAGRTAVDTFSPAWALLALHPHLAVSVGCSVLSVVFWGAGRGTQRLSHAGRARYSRATLQPSPRTGGPAAPHGRASHIDTVTHQGWSRGLERAESQGQSPSLAHGRPWIHPQQHKVKKKSDEAAGPGWSGRECWAGPPGVAEGPRVGSSRPPAWLPPLHARPWRHLPILGPQFPAGQGDKASTVPGG